MGTEHLVYELLAAPAGALLVATVAVGLAALMVAWPWPWPGRPARVHAETLVTGACVAERLAWPPAPARQADPDAPGAPRPRAPDGARTRAA
jgi:hypothetical protein